MVEVVSKTGQFIKLIKLIQPPVLISYNMYMWSVRLHALLQLAIHI